MAMRNDRSFSTLFIDLDDTMYPPSSGLWEAIRTRMISYMHTTVGISMEDIPSLQSLYYQTYGTTMRGLQENHGVDPDDYLRYVHDLHLQDYLLPDPALKAILDSLPQPKWIFTNADAFHAKRVLSILNVHSCFTGIIDVRALDYDCKPFPQVYLRAIEIANAISPDCCVLIDDAYRNLQTAKEMGFFTILIGQNDDSKGAHVVIESLHDLPETLPELWREAQK